MRGPVFHVDGGRPRVVDEHGRTHYLDTEEGRRVADQVYGVRTMDVDTRPVGNTPAQDWQSDPRIVDPRPVRRLDEKERKAIRYFASKGAYMIVAGFETWRASDRWIYIDCLTVHGPTTKHQGLSVGPIEVDWVDHLRMVGNQLAMRMEDPNGNGARSGGYGG